MAPADLDYALGNEVLEDIAEADRETRGEIRRLLENVENQLSYVRRVAQSRIDIAKSEFALRKTGTSRSDLSDVIQRLPDVLCDRVEHSGLARLGDIEIDPDPAYLAVVDDVVSPMPTLEVGRLHRRDLQVMISDLESIEAMISGRRQILHERLDTLHAATAGIYDHEMR